MPIPLALRAVRLNDGCAASGEGIKHDIALVSRGLDDALKELWRLLRLVPLLDRGNARYVPNVVTPNPG